jgi:hypothetical protein
VGSGAFDPTCQLVPLLNIFRLQALHDDLDRYANQFHELSVMLLGGHADADGAMPNFELWFRNCPKLMELKFGGYFYRRGQDGGPERVLSLPDEV